MNRSHRIASIFPAAGLKAGWLLAVIMMGVLVTAAGPDAEKQQCFDDEAGGQVCVQDAFLTFWQQQGGIAIFGKPLAAPVAEMTPAGSLTVQYFEGARLELHPANPAPYNVLLGRIGAERLRTLGGAQEMNASEVPGQNCKFFAATGHNICDAFLSYWRSHGLQLDGWRAVSSVESLALLGLPLTAARVEAGPSGEALLTQWFERARLVQHSDGTVAATALGREILGPRTAPAAPPAQQPTLVPTAVPSPTPTRLPGTTSPPTPTLVPTATAAPTATAIPLPTLTPTPSRPAPGGEPATGVPFPTVPCNRNVPSAANGLQLWVIDPTPPREEDQMVACVRLVLNNNIVRSVPVNVYRHYGGDSRPARAQSTGYDGVASFIFYIGPGSPGIPTHLEAVTTHQGRTYQATLWLTGP